MRELQAAGIDVLYDDRDARPGVKFADAELLGIPHRIVVGERGLERGVLEYKPRTGDGAATCRWTRSCSSCAAAGRRERLSACGPSPYCRPGPARRVCRQRPRARDRQRDPELRGVIAAAIGPAECFEDKYERAVWFA